MIFLVDDFFLLSPVALVGLASLIIPILIHLFNPSRGKLVLIGNIELIKKIKNIRVTEAKINQWLLLSIRLAIFLLLVMLLADLIKQDKSEYSKQIHILITQDWLNNATEEDLAKLKINHKSDLAFMLAPGFKNVTIGSLEVLEGTKTDFEPGIGTDALLAEIQEKGLVTENTIIYATNSLQQFSAEKNRSLPGPSYSWRIKQLDQNKDLTPSLNITVYYSQSRELDRRYLKLALDTISKISKTKLSVDYVPVNATGQKKKTSSFSERNDDWIFWLNEDVIPVTIIEKLKQGSFIFTDISGERSITDNRLKNIITLPIGQIWTQFYSNLFTQVEAHIKPVWHNKMGQVALSQETVQQSKVFRFYSRFHPNWNDLIGKVEFPIILADILSEHPNLNQQKRLSLSEIAPVLSQNPSESDSKAAFKIDNRSQRSILLLIVCLLWLLERWLSEKKRGAHD